MIGLHQVATGIDISIGPIGVYVMQVANIPILLFMYHVHIEMNIYASMFYIYNHYI